MSINAPRKAPSDDVASELRKFALIYGCRLRWPVFPVNPLNKNPLIKDGFKGASTDEATIKSWWTKWPMAMIGVAAGDAVGFFVVDLDAGTDKKTGEIFELDAIMATLECELGVSLPPTWTVATPRGGRHLYFELPKGIAIGNRTGLIRRVDVRSTGGYVIVPPSRRDDGKVYTWLSRLKTDRERPAVAPIELVHCIARRGKWEPKVQAPSSGAPAVSGPVRDEAVNGTRSRR